MLFNGVRELIFFQRHGIYFKNKIKNNISELCIVFSNDLLFDIGFEMDFLNFQKFFSAWINEFFFLGVVWFHGILFFGDNIVATTIVK